MMFFTVFFHRYIFVPTIGTFLCLWKFTVVLPFSVHS